jgi:hypothetical protein
MDSQSKIALMNAEMDAVIGTSSRVPRLWDSDGFDEWKQRFPQYIMRTEPKLWRSFLTGPKTIYQTNDKGEESSDAEKLVKDIADYTDNDWNIKEIDNKAYATLAMALAPNIAAGFRQYDNAKSLWEALLEVYDGNEDMKESRQDSLRQKFNMFNHVLGESLESQTQRFTSLVTQMTASGIVLSNSEINKKLLNSLPRRWSTHVAVIKRTKNLSTESLARVISTLNACEEDDRQQELNYSNSHSAANLGVSANNAFSALPTSALPPTKSVIPSISPSPTFPSPQPAPASHTTTNAPGVDENIALVANFVNCYNAFVAGNLIPPMTLGELDQIHPDDVEELDIQWQIAMAVFRAKKFGERTGKKNWGINADKKLGFQKEKL